MEETQVMDLDSTCDFDSSAEEDGDSLVARLEIEGQEYQIRKGTVKIGRDTSTCMISLQNPKISKEHAAFEADQSSVTLTDLGSRNKTKMGKMILKPHVRYALQGGENLTFGALKGIFTLNTQNMDSEGSSKAMGNTASNRYKEASTSDINDDSIIGPTPQPRTVDTSVNDDDSIIDPTPRPQTHGLDFVAETPAPQKGKSNWNEIGGKTFVAQTPTTQSTPNNNITKSALKNFISPHSPVQLSPIMSNRWNTSDGIPMDDELTQIYTPQKSQEKEPLKNKHISSDEDDDCEPSTQVFEPPTKVFKVPNRVFDAPTQIFDAPTQVFDAPTQVFDAPTQVFDAPTQVFDAPTQVFDAPTQVFDAPTQVFDASTQVFDAPTQVFDAPTQVFDAPTQVFDAPTQVFDAPTQVFDAPTQVFDAPTQVCDGPTQIFDAPTQIFDAPTQVFQVPRLKVDNVAKESNKAKQPSRPTNSDYPTQVFDSSFKESGDDTQVVHSPTQITNVRKQRIESLKGKQTSRISLTPTLESSRKEQSMDQSDDCLTQIFDPVAYAAKQELGNKGNDVKIGDKDEVAKSGQSLASNVKVLASQEINKDTSSSKACDKLENYPSPDKDDDTDSCASESMLQDQDQTLILSHSQMKTVTNEPSSETRDIFEDSDNESGCSETLLKDVTPQSNQNLECTSPAKEKHSLNEIEKGYNTDSSTDVEDTQIASQSPTSKSKTSPAKKEYAVNDVTKGYNSDSSTDVEDIQVSSPLPAIKSNTSPAKKEYAVNEVTKGYNCDSSTDVEDTQIASPSPTSKSKPSPVKEKERNHSLNEVEGYNTDSSTDVEDNDISSGVANLNSDKTENIGKNDTPVSNKNKDIKDNLDPQNNYQSPALSLSLGSIQENKNISLPESDMSKLELTADSSSSTLILTKNDKELDSDAKNDFEAGFVTKCGQVSDNAETKDNETQKKAETDQEAQKKAKTDNETQKKAETDIETQKKTETDNETRKNAETDQETQKNTKTETHVVTVDTNSSNTNSNDKLDNENSKHVDVPAKIKPNQTNEAPSVTENTYPVDTADFGYSCFVFDSEKIEDNNDSESEKIEEEKEGSEPEEKDYFESKKTEKEKDYSLKNLEDFEEKDELLESSFCEQTDTLSLTSQKLFDLNDESDEEAESIPMTKSSPMTPKRCKKSISSEFKAEKGIEEVASISTVTVCGKGNASILSPINKSQKDDVQRGTLTPSSQTKKEETLQKITKNEVSTINVSSENHSSKEPPTQAEEFEEVTPSKRRSKSITRPLKDPKLSKPTTRKVSKEEIEETVKLEVTDEPNVIKTNRLTRRNRKNNNRQSPKMNESDDETQVFEGFDETDMSQKQLSEAVEEECLVKPTLTTQASNSTESCVKPPPMLKGAGRKNAKEKIVSPQPSPESEKDKPTKSSLKGRVSRPSKAVEGNSLTPIQHSSNIDTKEYLEVKGTTTGNVPLTDDKLSHDANKPIKKNSEVHKATDQQDLESENNISKTRRGRIRTAPTRYSPSRGQASVKELPSRRSKRKLDIDDIYSSSSVESPKVKKIEENTSENDQKDPSQSSSVDMLPPVNTRNTRTKKTPVENKATNRKSIVSKEATVSLEQLKSVEESLPTKVSTISPEVTTRNRRSVIKADSKASNRKSYISIEGAKIPVKDQTPEEESFPTEESTLSPEEVTTRNRRSVIKADSKTSNRKSNISIEETKISLKDQRSEEESLPTEELSTNIPVKVSTRNRKPVNTTGTRGSKRKLSISVEETKVSPKQLKSEEESVDTEESSTTILAKAKKSTRGRATFNSEPVVEEATKNQTSTDDTLSTKSTRGQSRKSTTTRNSTNQRSTRNSQQLQSTDLEMNPVSVGSPSSKSSLEEFKPDIQYVKRTRGKRGRVTKAANGCTKSSQEEREMELSTISESSSNTSMMSVDHSIGSRPRSRAKVSPARSNRSTRSNHRGRSPSVSKEEVLWSPCHRQGMANKRPLVMFTGFKDAKAEKVIKDAGGRLSETAVDCSVLVVNAVKRTCKFLACMGKGIPIVSENWISATKQAGNFVDPWEYLVRDKEAEKKFDFNLRQTLERAAKQRLLVGYSIHVTDNVKPSPQEMREIIECAGGEYLDNPPVLGSPKTVVISCPQDKKNWTKFRKLKVALVSSDFILCGILQHKILIPQSNLS